jgi:hypothetical protein
MTWLISGREAIVPLRHRELVLVCIAAGRSWMGSKRTTSQTVDRKMIKRRSTLVKKSQTQAGDLKKIKIVFLRVPFRARSYK